MAGIKSLAKDTAIYGLSSILGRFLNWCLVPLYTIMFPPEEYGIVTYIYSIVALAIVILIYGMETTLFRFAKHDDYKASTVYTTALTSLGFTSSLFVALVLLFLNPIAEAMDCADTPSFVWVMAVTVALDAFTAIPFAYLRNKQRPIRFATLKLINIGLNIGLNLFFILLCPWIWKTSPALIEWFYNPTYGIGYIFVANLISSAVTLLLLFPEIKSEGYVFNGSLLRKMLVFSFPLLIAGLAGIMNQNIDKILYPKLITDSVEAMTGLGIYGANYKIAVVMIMFVQAFRFAYEPLMFSRKSDDPKQKHRDYRKAMTFYVIFSLLIFLGVMFYLDFLKYFIDKSYFVGLKVVPILLMAEFFYGIFFNLSLWYKSIDKTYWALVFTIVGFVVMVSLNVLFVPKYGYIACAWAALACNIAMMLVSYIVGRKKNPIPYDLGRIAFYFVLAMALFGLSYIVATPHFWLNIAIRTILIIIYLGVVLKKEDINPRALIQRNKVKI